MARDTKISIGRKGGRKMMIPAKESLDLGVIVRDIEASLSFYRDTLGLQFVEKIPLWFGTMYRLRFGTSDFKLIQANTTPPKGPTGIDAQLGFRYVTFLVKNLSEICQKLEAKGIPFHLSPREIRPGVKIAMVLDPDENVVEFVERA
jgi:catechol 2,3-dioxygenase-like lactoylglutathione lyase family enzyme